MALNKQFFPLPPHGVDQRTEPSQLAPGKLTEAVNVRQPTPGLYEKRAAYLPMDRDGITNGALGRGLASTGETLIQRTDEAIYARAAAAWVPRLKIPPVSVPPAPTVLAASVKPSMAVAGAYRYYFARGLAIDSWSYRVVEAATDVEIQSESPVATASPPAGNLAVPVVAAGKVWLFIGVGSSHARYVHVAKFDPATPTVAPAVTTYYDGGTDGSEEIYALAARVVPSGDVVVGIAGVNLAKAGGGLSNAVVSFLDTATGAARGAPGSVGDAGYVSIGGTGSASWLEDDHDPTPAAYYLAVCNGTFSAPQVYAIDKTALTLTTATTLGADTRERVTGYFKHGTALYVTVGSDLGGSRAEDTTFAYVHDDAGTNLQTLWRRHGMTVISRLFLARGEWYVICGFDDNRQHLQGTYYLVRVSDGAIVARGIFGPGGDAWQAAAVDTAAIPPSTAVVVVNDNAISAAVNAFTAGTGYVTRELRFVIDDMGAYMPGPLVAAQEEQEIAVPGGWPMHVVAGAEVAEYTTSFPVEPPVLAEDAVVSGAGLDTGTYTGYYLYAFRDAAGNVHRSRPSEPANVNVTAASKTVKFTVVPMHATNSRKGDWQIELYLTAADTTAPFLQVTIPNDPAAATVDVGSIVEIKTDEELYTYAGNELFNYPPPAFGACFAWRDRLFLSDTDADGDVWVSKEKDVGVGYGFTPALTFNIGEAGRIFAGGAVDSNYAALFGKQGIWIISGDGPDSATGGGQYQPTRLPGTIGCVNPRAVCTTPAGLVFQGTDGRWYLIPRGAPDLLDLGAGVEGYRSRSVSATVFDVETQQLRVHLSGPCVGVEDVPGVPVVVDDRDPCEDKKVSVTGADAADYLRNKVQSADASVVFDVIGGKLDLSVPGGGGGGGGGGILHMADIVLKGGLASFGAGHESGWSFYPNVPITAVGARFAWDNPGETVDVRLWDGVSNTLIATIPNINTVGGSVQAVSFASGHALTAFRRYIISVGNNGRYCFSQPPVTSVGYAVWGAINLLPAAGAAHLPSGDITYGSCIGGGYGVIPTADLVHSGAGTIPIELVWTNP